MTGKNLLDDKRILIVDDEPDILDTLEELLPMCHVVKSTHFEDAKRLLDTQEFDMTILDIMGVDGYQLLQIAREREIIAVMLTAHALSVEDTAKSYREGAASYIPKEEMVNIVTYLNDILEAKRKGKDPWWRWLARLADFWRNEFGPNWQHPDKEFC